MTSTPLPPSSPTPIWLQKLQYTLNPLDYLTTAAQRYGTIFNAPIIGKHPVVLIISDPKAIQQVFSSETKQLTTPANQLLQPLVGDGSIFGMEGSRHRQERKLLMPAFHGEQLRTYGQLISDLTDQAMQKIPLNTPFAARSVMQDISLEVILRVVFGLSEGDQFKRLKTLLVELTDSLQTPWVGGLLFFPSLQQDWSPWGRIRALQRQIRSLLYTEIQAKRRSLETAPQRESADSNLDILSLLIRAQDEEGRSLTDEELHDELMTLLLAGHETTATAIAWALYWIHQEPSVYRTLCTELAEVPPDANPMSIMQLPYLTAVCQETLRIYPVIILTVPREVKDPMELMGYSLAPGTRVYGCIYLTHRHPDLYPDPEQFKPERFLERQFSPYEFFPFGGGTRRCLGEVLALFEMKRVLATILSHYELALADQTPEIPQRRGVILAPKRGVQMIVKGKRTLR